MSWEFEGRFDGVVSDTDDLMADYWKSEPTAIRVGAMGYRTKTTKAGSRLEAEVYPLFGREKTARLRKAKKHITPERQSGISTGVITVCCLPRMRNALKHWAR